MSIGLIDAVANDVLDLLLGTPGVLPGTVWIGLLLATPNQDGTNVVEPVGNGYQRIAVTNDSTNWPAAVSRRKTHSADIVWPAATGNWGVITHVGIFDAASGGALRVADPLTTPRTVNNTDIFRFLATTSPLAITI